MTALAAAVTADPGRFSIDGLTGWELQTFRGRRPTDYRLEWDGGVRALRADCRASASGWIWRERVDLGTKPILSWRWRVERGYGRLDETTKAGDDFPARVYVVRDGGWAFWRTRALIYVWATATAAGNHWTSPYTRQAHVVVVRNAAADAGQWRDERRDVAEDFGRYFGLALNAVDGVALMSDCDDSGREGRAWYGDMTFAPR